MWSRFRNGERTQGRRVKGGSRPRVMGLRKVALTPQRPQGQQGALEPVLDRAPPMGTQLRSGPARGRWLAHGATSVLSLCCPSSVGEVSARAPEHRPLQRGPQGIVQEHVPRQTHWAEPTGSQGRRQTELRAALVGTAGDREQGTEVGAVSLRGVCGTQSSRPRNGRSWGLGLWSLPSETPGEEPFRLEVTVQLQGLGEGGH